MLVNVTAKILWEDVRKTSEPPNLDDMECDMEHMLGCHRVEIVYAEFEDETYEEGRIEWT